MNGVRERESNHIHTHTQVDRLDAFVHQLIDSSGQQQQGVSVVRRPLAGALSFVLVIIAFILATTQKLTCVLRYIHSSHHTETNLCSKVHVADVGL